MIMCLDKDIWNNLDEKFVCREDNFLNCLSFTTRLRSSTIFSKQFTAIATPFCKISLQKCLHQEVLGVTCPKCPPPVGRPLWSGYRTLSVCLSVCFVILYINPVGPLEGTLRIFSALRIQVCIMYRVHCFLDLIPYLHAPAIGLLEVVLRSLDCI